MSASSANPLFSCLDSVSNKQLGENGHVEYKWSSNTHELFTQIYFQLVRAKSQSETLTLRENINRLITTCKLNIDNFESKQMLCNLYKLAGHTRDIEYKGERQLAYAQVWVWHKHYPELAYFLIKSFVHYVEDDDSVNPSKHQYGSWNDIKYFCGAIKELNGGNENHPLIDYAISLIVEQLQKDIRVPEGKPISLAARHTPREGSRFDWIFKRIAQEVYPYCSTAITDIGVSNANRKSWMHLRKRILAPLNKRLDTVQIKMASGAKGEGQWDQIDFNTITSKTMRLYSKAWQNITKTGETRTSEQHRIDCAQHFKEHINKAVSGDKTAKVRGKRCNTGELVADAIAIHTSGCVDTETKRINLQWDDNAENNVGLGNMISIVDVSGSMTVDNSTPLNNAIGLGLRISEKASPAFKDRVLTFSENPTWVNLEDCDSFCQKVQKVRTAPWGMSTNIYKAFQLILDGIIQSEMSPTQVEDIVLCVFSDMNINQGAHGNSDVMHDQVLKMFSEAGIKSKYNTPFKAPHLLWWNLRTTSGFPTLSTTKNCTMLSGYNAALLNAFQSKGVDALSEYTPYKMVVDILSEQRYNMLERSYNSIIN